MAFRSWLCFALLAACAPISSPPRVESRHTEDAEIRAGFGDERLHVWWPVTSAEASAIRGIDRAKQGDVHALLELAILGSGNRRDDASYARYVARFDRFVAEERPGLATKDHWHRGDSLLRDMHRTFFGAYAVHQARLTTLFDDGQFNCISSALLYALLARALDLPVSGVMLKTHAFVQIDDFEVETTSKDGFGQLHDATYYADSSIPYGDYETREIVPLHVLVARAMNDRQVLDDPETAARLTEIAQMIAPDDYSLAFNRMVGYLAEAKFLREHHAARTALRLFEVTAPFVVEVKSHFSENARLMSLATWIDWYRAVALQLTGRGHEALAVADVALDRIQPSWEDAAQLRFAFSSVIHDLHPARPVIR